MRVAFATRRCLSGAFRYGVAGLLLLAMPLLTAAAVHAQTKCGSQDKNNPAPLPRPGYSSPPGSPQPTLEVTGYCIAKAADPKETTDPSLNDYYYGKVNVTKGGALIFAEGLKNARD